MNLKDLERLYLTRQSCRAFDKNKEVDKGLVKEICSIATLAPSACNAQPWKLIALYGEEKKKIEVCMQSLGMNKFASDAPCLIAVCKGASKLSAKVATLFSGDDFTKNDLGILTAHLVLAAESAGLNTCILGWRNEKKLAAALNLPKDTLVPHVIALGYQPTDYELRPKQRKPFDEVFEERE